MFLIEQLIEEVGNHPLLYDNTLPEHKEAELRNLSWKEIARKLCPDNYNDDIVDKLRLKWRSLRDNYVKSFTKQQRNECIRPYRYRHLMQFLEPFVNSGGRTVKELKRENLIPIAFRSVNVEERDPLTEGSDAESRQSCSSNTRKAKKRKALSLPEELPESDLENFFHSMALTVKKLRPITVARIKKQIANIVMDAEIEDLQVEPEQTKIEFGLS